MNFKTNMIEKNSSEPIYKQIKSLIKKQIQNGDFKIGEKIPSERELSEKLEVSRMTIRKAINDMVDEKLLLRKPGVGTYVKNNVIIEKLKKLSGFTQMMENKGIVPESKVLDFKLIKAEIKIAQQLNISTNDKILKIIRLRLGDEIPLAIEYSYVPYSIIPDVTENILEGNSLCDLLEKNCIVIGKARETMEAGIANELQANLLNIEPGDPILLRKRNTMDINDTLIEYVTSYYRGDKFKFYFELDNELSKTL